ncbi:SDR family oxidoreductase [Clostridium sp.]|uniref:SDR family oxidoreductase n=1 Tax=Clostridium sp. TaxID=1506 RepID=UPI0034A11CEB
MIDNTFPKIFDLQEELNQPGIEQKMNPKPVYEHKDYMNNGKRLNGKIAIITGGDSGIGRAVSLAFAREGATVVIVYLNEKEDADETLNLIKRYNNNSIGIQGDLADYNFCKKVIKTVSEKYGIIDILVNNAAQQYPVKSILELTNDQLIKTFSINVFSAFYLIKEALSYMSPGSCIINTTSVVAYHGHKELIDYSASKGALTSLTRSLSLSLADMGIRVNAVAPGPIWTPLIPASFKKDQFKSFGSNTVLKRPGQPVELAEAYVFLASQNASFITGETIHVNGGEMINN